MAKSTVREKNNWWIHSLYTRNEHDECLAMIDRKLRESAFAEYAIYVKGSAMHCETLVIPNAYCCPIPLFNRPHFSQARANSGVFDAVPVSDVFESNQHVQPEAGRPLALLAGQARAGD